MRKFKSGALRDNDTDKIDKELYWAAGFYDGEGSVSCTSNNNNPYTRIQLSIGQKNYNEQIADTLYRFQRAVGAGHIYKKTRIGKEINQHQFIICKQSDVWMVLNKIYPLISESKQQQALKAWCLLEKGYKILHNKQIKNKQNETL